MPLHKALYHVVRFKAWLAAKRYFGSEVDELIAFNNCMNCICKRKRSVVSETRKLIKQCSSRFCEILLVEVKLI